MLWFPTMLWLTMSAPASPWMFAGLVAAMSIAAGVAVAVFGRVWKRRRLRLSQAHPNEPWLWDHDWNPRGAEIGPLRRLSRWMQRPHLIPWVLFYCAAAGCYALLRDGLEWPALLLASLVATWFSWSLWRLHGAGTARLAFTKFPCHPGETVRLQFGASEGGAHFRRVEFRLSFVREIRHGRGAAWPLAEEVGVERRPPGMTPGPDEDVEIAFDVPPHAGVTRLSASEATYWVLDVVANTSAGPFAESFLVPIYERPSA